MSDGYRDARYSQKYTRVLMGSDRKRYYDSVTRYLSEKEIIRGVAAIERLKAAWRMDPARVEDLERLDRVQFQLRLGYLPLRDLSWLRQRITEAP